MKRLAVISAILASAAVIMAPAALADGDPASDVLVGYSLFNPVDSGVSLSSAARLDAVLAAGKRAGFQLRVALIASPTDLGTVTAFWGRNPRLYAGYLGYELSEQYGGQVLVVMPNGFGLYGPHSGSDVVSAAERDVHAVAPGSGEQLATAALSAVPLLARAAGHPIPAAALASAEHTTTPASNGSASSAFGSTAVVALLAGALLITLAWALSLRARPLQLGRRLS